MPQRTFKSRERRSKVRDAKLIVIAAEGTKTERKYFLDLAAHEKYRNSRVHVEVLERDSTSSAPEYILEELDNFKRQFSLKTDDELWLVIDFDRWKDAKISEIAGHCRKKKYFLAISNPCFELWLLLHLTSLDVYSDDEKELLFANKKENNRTKIELELLKLLGTYNKSNLQTEHFLEKLEDAIAHAEALDVNPHERWTNGLGSRVYRLVTSIIATKNNNF